MGSATVPLGRALLSSYTLSIVTILLSVTVWLQFAMQILTGSTDSQIYPLPEETAVSLTNTVLLGTIQVSLPNGTSFPPTSLAGCTSVTDRWTDHATVTSVAVDVMAFTDAA